MLTPKNELQMLFNKENTGTNELKSLIGFLYASNEFSNIEMDITLAEEDIIKLIGKPVYTLANNHYNDLDESSGSGSASGSSSGSSGSITSDLLDKLVAHIQLPVALFAYKSFCENRDISHEDSGRKVKIDEDNEKLPWEWMINRDDAAILRKAHRATDRLISFLEDNEDSISAWKNSDSQKSARECFIQNASEFNEVFPIDESRQFYLRILPFMKAVERNDIKPCFDVDEYNLIKEAIKDGDTSEYSDYIEIAKQAIAPLTMSMAIKRLALTLIPEGVIQYYVSGTETAKAQSIPKIELINNISKTFEKDGNRYLLRLQELISKNAAEEAGEDFEDQDIIPDNDEDNNYFRT
jgi:hypothetical protein